MQTTGEVVSLQAIREGLCEHCAGIERQAIHFSSTVYIHLCNDVSDHELVAGKQQRVHNPNILADLTGLPVDDLV